MRKGVVRIFHKILLTPLLPPFLCVSNVLIEGDKRMKQVVAALIICDEKILICQRTEDQAMPLKWEFPGGKVERDEDLKDALRRELEEELGIDAEIGSKIAAIQHSYASGASLALYFYRVDRFKNEID